MRLEWSRYATADRERIYTYLEALHPHAAIAADDRIGRQTALLRRHPLAGRAGRIEGTRELVISRTPYIVAYRAGGNAIWILRVLHSWQCWPEAMPE
jgi:toxin ParE1/3/4